LVATTDDRAVAPNLHLFPFFTSLLQNAESVPVRECVHADY